VRRPICDIALLIFHLVLSSFTFDGIDITIADKILKWNLKRYPNGAIISRSRSFVANSLQVFSSCLALVVLLSVGHNLTKLFIIIPKQWNRKSNTATFTIFPSGKSPSLTSHFGIYPRV